MTGFNIQGITNGVLLHSLSHRMWTMAKLNVRIPYKLRTELRDHCQRQNRPASEVVRDSLRRFLAVQGFLAFHKNLTPLAKARGILTDDDVFRMIS